MSGESKVELDKQMRQRYALEQHAALPGTLASYNDLAEVLKSLRLLVRETRRARGLSGRAAAHQIGCSPSAIVRLEGGDDVSVQNATLILRWLDQTSRNYTQGASQTCSDST